MDNVKIYSYEYYLCTKKKKPTCSQRAVTGQDLERQIIDILNRVSIPLEFHKWAMDWLKQENQEKSTDRSIILNSQQKAYDQCLKQIDSLIDMRANGELTEEEFSRKKTELTKEKLHLFELLNDIDGRASNWLENAESWFDFARDAKKVFENGDISKKKAILTALGSKPTLKGKKLCIYLQEPLALMEEMAHGVSAKKAGFETAGNPVNLSKNRASNPDFALMLPARDYVRNWPVCPVII